MKFTIKELQLIHEAVKEHPRYITMWDGEEERDAEKERTRSNVLTKLDYCILTEEEKEQDE
jgi:hypothetical protein